MKSRKNQEKIARYLYKNSLSDGIVDSSKVNSMLKQIMSLKPPQLINILKIYRKMILSALSREELIVESASKIVDKKFAAEILKKTQAKRIRYKIKPSIVTGMKITHGDWVYDETLRSKLANLTKSI